jgi:hypothetical protein
MPTIRFTGSGQPSTLTNLGLSPTDCGGGGGSYASCAAGVNKGLHSNPDAGADVYIYETSPITITSSFGLMGSLTSFRYSVVKPAWSSGASWSMVVELIPYTGPGSYGTPFRLDNGTELTNQTRSATCDLWSWNPYSPKFDPNPGVLSGQYVIRITISSNNTNNSGLNCVRFDEIIMDWTILAATDAEPNGLTEPSFSTSTGTSTVNSSGELLADVTLNKSAQSAVNCAGGSGVNPSLCGLTAVAGRHIAVRTSKTTGDSAITTSTGFSIPYQTGTWTYTVTGAIHEDANYTYKHFFEVQEWNSGETDLENVFIECTTPSKPARTLSINYFAGVFTASLNGPITGTTTVTGLQAKGYSNNTCATHIETHNQGSPIVIVPGDLLEESADGSSPLTCDYSIRRKIYNGASINGTGLSSGGTVDINGHTVTLSINSGCNPYGC